MCDKVGKRQKRSAEGKKIRHKKIGWLSGETKRLANGLV